MNRPSRLAGGVRRLIGSLAVVALLSLTGCSTEVDVSDSSAASNGEVGERALQVATELEQAGLTTLASAVREVDLDEVVESDGFTLFAPDDEAFQSLTADELADLTSDSGLLVSMLRDHVVRDAITSDELAESAEVTTVGGATLSVGSDGDVLTVDDAEVTESLEIGDGTVVHVVDALLARE